MSSKLAVEIVRAFEWINLNHPDNLVLFEYLYNIQGKEAVAKHPRFKKFLDKLESLMKDFLEKDEVDIDSIAKDQAQAHIKVQVNSATFIELCMVIEDLVNKERPDLFPRFLKHMRSLQLKVASHHDALLKQAREKLEEILEVQKETIKELSTPIIPVWNKILMAPIIGSFDSMRIMDLQEDIMDAVSKEKPSSFLMDLSGVCHVNTNIIGDIVKLINAIKLLGTQTMLVGINPCTAQQLVNLGVNLEDIPAFSTLEQGLKKAIKNLDSQTFS